MRYEDAAERPLDPIAERAGAANPVGPPHPWPSEIAERNRRQPGNDHGARHKDHGHSL